jgi:hypothetical protein
MAASFGIVPPKGAGSKSSRSSFLVAAAAAFSRAIAAF